MHATFSIIDANDETLGKAHGLGTAAAPNEDNLSDGLYSGSHFTTTAEEKAHSVPVDGSIKLRAVVRLFLDGEA